MKRKKHIAYGSNKNLKQMAQRCPGAEYINSTVIEECAFASDCLPQGK